MAYLLGLDLGTGSIKASVYDSKIGKVISISSEPTPIKNLKNGWSEHVPENLWKITCRVICKAFQLLETSRVKGLAISSFGDTGLALDSFGKSLSPLVTWYDTRCYQQVQWLDKQIHPSDYFTTTGLHLSTSLGISKWLWAVNQDSGLPEKTKTWLGTPDYILWRLTGEKATDFSNASRSGFFDPRERKWSPRLLEIAHLQKEQLPELLPSGSIAGRLSSTAASEIGLPAGIPCVLGGHDHLCAAITAYKPNGMNLVDSCGTAESLLVIRDSFETSNSLYKGGFQIYSHVIPNKYVVRGGLRSAGGSILWLASLIIDKNQKDLDSVFYQLGLESEAGMGMAGPIWLPHFNGSGTPISDISSLGAVIGLRSINNKADLYRGLLESLSFWLRENVDCLESIFNSPFDEITLMGGTTRLEILNRIKATILNRDLLISQVPEPSATGAALLAGIGTGVFGNLNHALETLKYQPRVVSPIQEYIQWYEDLYSEVYMQLFNALKDVNKKIAKISKKEKGTV